MRRSGIPAHLVPILVSLLVLSVVESVLSPSTRALIVAGVPSACSAAPLGVKSGEGLARSVYLVSLGAELATP